MKRGLFVVFCLMFLAVGFASAQTARKTVTNADLEKFRQKRLAAEKDYRDNYEKMGFPSPEELEKQHEQDRKDMSELSARIEKENYDREQQQRATDYWQYQNRMLYNLNNQNAYNGNGYYSPFNAGSYGYSGGYSGYGFSNGYYNNNRKFRRGGGFYNTIAPGTPFSALGGVRINTNGIRINTGGVINSGIRISAGSGGFRGPR